MSRTRTQVPVLSPFHLQEIELELGRHRMDELPQLHGLERVEALCAHVDALATMAAAMGLPTQRLAQLAGRLDDLAPAPPAPDATPLVELAIATPTPDGARLDDLTDGLLLELAGLETSIVGAARDARGLEIAGAAAVEALHRIGLFDVKLEVIHGELTITGCTDSGLHVALMPTDKNVVVTVEDPPDLVNPLDPAAGQACRRAADLDDLVRQIHDVLPQVFGERGAHIGAVEVVEPARRGRASRTGRRSEVTRRAGGGVR